MHKNNFWFLVFGLYTKLLMSSLFKFFKSFFYAIRGIVYALDSQRNMKVHSIIFSLVLVFGWYFHLSHGEWISIAIVSAMVISTEIINTAIEDLCNMLKPKLKLNYSDTTNIRDAAAGAVLVTALAAFVVGAIVFAPKFAALMF